MKLLLITFSFVSLCIILATGELADFGGDVSQYMNLLEESSAMSFKPSRSQVRGFPGMPGNSFGMRMSGVDEHRQVPGAPGGAGGGLDDFGGNYGSYLKLLEGKSALGFNPQPDPIADNQDLQTDVFGGMGGLSGKFWDMYKGSSSYDSLDEETDGETLETMGLETESENGEEFGRQAQEEDQPEDESNKERKAPLTTGITSFKDQTYIFAFKPSKEKMKKLYEELKVAIKENDKMKMAEIMDRFDLKGEEESKTLRKISEDSENEADATTQFNEFIDKMKDNIPDPISTSKGLSSNYHNLTIYGLSNIHSCGKVRKSYGNHWKGSACLPTLSSSIDGTSAPGVPFKGKVLGLFKDTKLQIVFRSDSSTRIHILSVKSSSESSKFVPTYDSSIPLNPWSKVSMSGYMVSKIKKVLPSLIDKVLLKILHIVEELNSST